MNELQLIYYDGFHETWDGKGWNIIDADQDVGVALRFDTWEKCVQWCDKNGYPYLLEARSE